MSEECPQCEREFKNSQALGVHRAKSHDVPWQDKQKLKKAYYEEGLSLSEMAERWGCNHNSVKQNMEKFGLDRRKAPQDPTRVPYHGFAEDTSDHVGAVYEEIQPHIDGSSYCVKVHRLVALAHGIIGTSEFLNGDVNVHHKNGHGLDNRPENLKAMRRGEHTSHHRPWEYNDWSG